MINPNSLTPIKRHGNLWLKRDDLFCVNGACGGKVRSCLALAQGAAGLVTAGARHSPQIQIIARVAEHLGIPCRCHTASGELTEELKDAERHGATIVQHRPGYNSVIVARAKADPHLSPLRMGARRRRWTHIPFGMQSPQAVESTRGQVQQLPNGVRRVVVTVGSGMTAAGILWGLKDQGYRVPVTGVVVGRDPVRTLDQFAPPGWRRYLTLVEANYEYQKHVVADVDGVQLDPHYEAKAADVLQAGDLFWIVGIRCGVVAE